MIYYRKDLNIHMLRQKIVDINGPREEIIGWKISDPLNIEPLLEHLS